MKVLLADGTEKLYTLNFDASAQNVGEQLFPKLTSSQQKDNGIEELKAPGSSVQDNTTTKPDGTLPSAVTFTTPASSTSPVSLPAMSLSTASTTRTF